MRRDRRIHLEATARDRERLRAWLRFIVVECRGKGPGLASQALHSDLWPDWYRSQETNQGENP